MKREGIVLVGEVGYRLIGGPVEGTVYSDRTELDNGTIIQFNKVDREANQKRDEVVRLAKLLFTKGDNGRV